MGLNSLISQIEKETEKKIQTIIENAKAQQEEIIKEAKKQAKKITQQAVQQAEEIAQNYREEKIAAAKTEEQRILLQAREEATDRALAQLWEAFVKFSQSSNYPKYLKKLAALALEEIDNKAAVALCNQKDKKLVQSFGLKVEKTIDCTAGLIVQTKDGKILVDYTFEAIFEQKKQKLKTQINTILAEKESNLKQLTKTKKVAKSK
ncbi:MAG: V-type ATP synthase subunit E [Candidatus Micrarchaeota archaeon]|nr:V-type ATP synthase subunit E [Candidatus Micrarchaeota archaeon]